MFQIVNSLQTAKQLRATRNYNIGTTTQKPPRVKYLPHTCLLTNTTTIIKETPMNKIRSTFLDSE